MRGKHWQEAIGQYAGQVPTPWAVYRPPVLGNFMPFELGICSYKIGATETYGQLLDKKRLLQDEEQGLLDAMKASGPGTAEQRVRLKAIDDEFNRDKPGSMAAHIAAEEDRRERERNAPAVGGAYGVADAALVSLDSGSASRSFTARPGVRKYAELFGGNLARDGFPTMESYLRTVHQGMADPRLQASTGSMTEGVGADGGWLVPTEYAAELLDSALETEIVRPRAVVYPMRSRQKQISGFSAADHTGGSIYGFEPIWMEEAGAGVPQKGTVVPIMLTAQKMALYAEASNELTADGMSFEEQLGTAIQASIGFGLDVAFLNGNGVGKPLGVLQDPALITVAAENAQAADSILYANLVKMLARLHPSLLAGSVWIANTTTLPQLATLTVPVGTGGQVIPVMTESDGSFKLLTRPVLFSEKVPVLGDQGDISLVNFSQYAIGLRSEVTVDKSNAPRWLNDEASYRAIVRVTGQGRWTGPVTPLHGDTLSWAVALAAR